MTPEQIAAANFIAKIAAAAVSSMAQTNVPASFTIAQGALESRWGASELAAEACNLFGVKADPSWTGPTFDLVTRECIAGQNGASDTWIQVVAHWRKYADWQGCMDDHAAFFHANNRYLACFPADGTVLTGEAFAQAVAEGGYATDPLYAQKVIGTMRAHNLAQYDLVTA